MQQPAEDRGGEDFVAGEKFGPVAHRRGTGQSNRPWPL